jgi:hypothetical protein
MKYNQFELLWIAIARLEAMVTALYPSANEEELLTGEKVKAMLNISESTLYRLRKAKIINSILIGKRHYYYKSFFTQELLLQVKKNDDPSKRFDE